MNKKLFGTALLGLLLSAATGTFVSCKDYDDDIENLQNQINGLKSLQTSVDGLKSDLAGVQSTCQANIASAIADLKNGDVKKALADAADAAAKASAASAEAATATSNAATAQAAADNAAAAAAAAQTAADAANTLAQAAKDAAAAAQAVADKAQSTADGISFEEKDAKALEKIAKLAEKIAGVEDALLKAADVEKMIADAQLAGSAVDADTLAKIKAALAQLEDATASIIGKRLTSLVYAPDTYINGIEAIEFVNLIYNDWSLDPKNWEYNFAQPWYLAPGQYWKGYKKDFVADFGSKVTYLVSPKAVTMDGIDELVFRVKDATNTRAAEAAAKELHMDVVDSAIVNGELVLHLKKTVDGNKWIPDAKLQNTIVLNYAGQLTAKNTNVSAGMNGTVSTNENGVTVRDPNINGKYGVTGEYSQKGEILDKSTNTFDAYLQGWAKANGSAYVDGTITVNNGSITIDQVKLNSNGTAAGQTVSVKEDLIIAALEAKLAESVKDENEKGKEVSVFSDWARVQETWEVPFIHDNYSRYSNGKLNCLNNCLKSSSHFYSFGQIYNNAWRHDELSGDKYGVEAIYDWDASIYDEVCDESHKTNDCFIGYKAVYDQKVDLNDLVTVCTKVCTENDKVDPANWPGREIKKEDLAKYGLKFEFHLMDFNVKNQGNTRDWTNQKNFAKLDEETGILIATSENGVEFNADAIGRTPVIQVVLRDTKKTDDPEDDAIIDVRYFKVKWLAEAPSSQVSEVEFPALFGFSCGNYTDGWIYEDVMNLFYTKLNNGKGIGKDQFYKGYPVISENIYRLPEGVELPESEDIEEWVAQYFSNQDEELAKYNKIGKAYWRNDSQASSQTQNVRLYFYSDMVNPRIDKDGDGLPYIGNRPNDWDFADESDYSVRGFFWFESTDGTKRVYVPVVLNVKKNSFYTQYHSAQWNKADGTAYGTESPVLMDSLKYRNANPILRSDKVYGVDNSYKSTQIFVQISKGYMYDGKNPDYNRLAKYAWAEGTLQANQYAQNKTPNPFAWTYTKFDSDPELLAKLPTNWKASEYGYKWFVLWDTYLVYGKPSVADNDAIVGILDGTVGARIEEDRIYLVDNNGKYWRDASTKGELVDYDNSKGIPTEAALLLVDQKVPVVVEAQQCYALETHDKYQVKFHDPLTFSDNIGAVTLKDIVYSDKKHGDEKDIVISKLELKESYGSLGKTIELWSEEESDENKALRQWYGVELVGVNNEAIMTNLNKDGTKDSTFDTKLIDIKDRSGRQLYDVKIGKYDDKGSSSMKEVDVDQLDADNNNALQPAGYTPTYSGADNTNLVLPTDEEIAAAKELGWYPTMNGDKQKVVAYVLENGKDSKSAVIPDYSPKTYTKTGSDDVEEIVIEWSSTLVGSSLAYNPMPFDEAITTEEYNAYQVSTSSTGYAKVPQTVYDGVKKEDATLATKLEVSAKQIVKTDCYLYTTAKNVHTMNASNIVYKVGDEYNTQFDGKGLKVVNAEDAHFVDITDTKDKQYPGYWCAGKQVAEKEVKVAVFVTMDEPNGAVNPDNTPKQVLYVAKDGANKYIYAYEVSYKKNNEVPVWHKKEVKEVFEKAFVPLSPKDSKGVVYFHNVSGNAIAAGDSFEVQIPVVVRTKWNSTKTGFIHVIVESGL